ncbi:MAG: DUF4838 domain-containing protein [Armatimonadetes bacterium]|nr:DUF4838 domain-containing protein [Armatimonadota bacterium]
MIMRYALFYLAMAGCCAAQAGGPLLLTHDGQPKAAIVISQAAPETVRFAAEELRLHIEKITGASLPVVTDDRQVQGNRILVGESARTRVLGLPGRGFGMQEYLIRFMPGSLVLMGKDKDRTDTGGRQLLRDQGRFGRALRFDGKSVLRLPETEFEDARGTMEAWVWLPAEKQAASHGTILRIDGVSPWTYHIVQGDIGTSRISYLTYDGSQVRAVSSGELAEGWHHVAATYDAAASRIELRIDGQSQGTAPYVQTACKGSALGVGGLPSGESSVGNPFVGLIDEVRLSGTARSFSGGPPEKPCTPDSRTVLLLHLDEPDGQPADSAAEGRGTPPPDLFGENGTLYAVCDFLERFCDVRWYAPGDIGCVLPHKKTLKVSGRDIRRAPAMVHRWITPTPLFMPGPPVRIPEREVLLWKHRMRIGGEPFWVSHSFYGYYERFLKEHPDWFAQGYPGQPPQMCYTHPGFIERAVRDARDYFDGKGAASGAAAMGDVFGLVPMDNMSWCRCERCRPLYNATQQSNPQFNNGKASDCIFSFVSRVAAEVGKTHPGKRIGVLAYSDYAYYPEKAGLPDNVAAQLCLHTRNWWCPSMEANDRKVLREWRERGPERPLYLWLYYNFPALNATYDNYRYFPGFFAHTAVKQMKLYRQAGIRGIFMEHSSEFSQTFLMDQLEFYVTLKLADNPRLDGNRLIVEFFRRYYGAAARSMQALYEAIEETFSNPAHYPPDIRTSPAHQHQNARLAWEWLGTEERMTRYADLMAHARAAARTPEEKERVGLFEKGIWDYMLEGRQEYMRKKG